MGDLLAQIQVLWETPLFPFEWQMLKNIQFLENSIQLNKSTKQLPPCLSNEKWVIECEPNERGTDPGVGFLSLLMLPVILDNLNMLLGCSMWYG